ncbi:phytanoyl-CoA dioxygenase family protein [Candidatus Poribacteria bacterium]|nr:phytanoyl-CoA dioxygenase family protein [Candidatus Poribacteria bacterium]
MAISREQQRELDERGCILIPDVLSESEIHAYKARLLALAEEAKKEGCAIMHTNGKGQHVRWLVNKGEMFEQLVAHPKVVPFFAYLLGVDYTLSTLTSNIISPSATDGHYHVDHVLGAMPEPLPSFPMVANSLWLLDDFTPENGGTRHIPGSHRSLTKPPAGITHHPQEARLSAPKGSVFLFNGAVWHSAGANQTEQPRRCLICFCCRSFLKPMFDFVHYLKPEVVARATPEMRRIYGFDSQPKPPDVPKK